MSFGIKLKQIREKNGLTQQQLADIAAVSRATIAGYETKGRQPDYSVLLRLSEIFNVSVDYLIGGEFLQKQKTHSGNQIITIGQNGKKDVIYFDDTQKDRLFSLIKAGFPELLESQVNKKSEYKKK